MFGRKRRLYGHTVIVAREAARVENQHYRGVDVEVVAHELEGLAAEWEWGCISPVSVCEVGNQLSMQRNDCCLRPVNSRFSVFASVQTEIVKGSHHGVKSSQLYSDIHKVVAPALLLALCRNTQW